MSTSAMVSYTNGEQPFYFSGAACFGRMNHLDGGGSANMQIMEWHPDNVASNPVRDYGVVGTDAYRRISQRMAMDFINSFGMWKDMYYVTSINTIACDLANTPADAMITGFMSMRDYKNHDWSFIFNRFEVSHKIEFALRSAGVYRKRFADAQGVLQQVNPEHGEMGVCGLTGSDDALGLYLLVYGTPEDFQGCWAQGSIGRTQENRAGYVRGSSGSDRTNRVRAREGRRSWSQMSSWLSSWLRDVDAEQLRGKKGRLTVHQFVGRINQRMLQLADVNAHDQQATVINNAFEELRDFYS